MALSRAEAEAEAARLVGRGDPWLRQQLIRSLIGSQPSCTRTSRGRGRPLGPARDCRVPECPFDLHYRIKAKGLCERHYDRLKARIRYARQKAAQS